MKTHTISNQTARKFILIKHGILGENNFCAVIDCPDKQISMSRRASNEAKNSGEIIPIYIEGIKNIFYCEASDKNIFERIEREKFLPRMKLISPSIFLLREKKIIEKIFCFAFRKNSLAILYGEKFVGRVYFSVDKKNKTLLVKNIFLENNFKNTKKFQDALSKTLQAFAKLKNCADISISRN